MEVSLTRGGQKYYVFMKSFLFRLFEDQIVALKRLKMEKEKEGFPITSLREVNTLLKSQHPNIVTVRVNMTHLSWHKFEVCHNH